MNTETADLRTAPVSAAAASDTRGILLTLMRREFWEHTALWRVPAHRRRPAGDLNDLLGKHRRAQ